MAKRIDMSKHLVVVVVVVLVGGTVDTAVGGGTMGAAWGLRLLSKGVPLALASSSTGFV